MIPKRIILENFLSFGSPATEIAFSDDEPLWVLGGPNGVGKSAVFDAMTYALYGEHRGGASDHDSLVRHGANGFRVIFEFEFNGVAYQITRNRPLKGRPTQSIKQAADGAWTKSVQLPAASGRQDQIKLWTERTLGIGFAAFKASVLLRQGESDAIITAGGADRLKILKKIIGLEAYEQLSDRVHGQTRRCRESLEELRTRRECLTPITEVEIKTAQDDLAQKENQRTTAQESYATAIARVPFARQWVTLDAESRNLSKHLQDAEVRAGNAERIRQDHARLNDLVAALPVFRQLLKLSDDMATADKSLVKLRVEAKQRADVVKAKELRTEIDSVQKVITTTDAVKQLEEQLAAFDPKLANQWEAARQHVQTATDALTATQQASAVAAKLLEQAKEKQDSFATVEVGGKCSLCGQPVSAKHAKEERCRLTGEIKRLEKKVKESAAQETTDKKAKKAAEEESAKLDQQTRKQEKTAQDLATKKETLKDLGVTATSDELRAQLAEKNAELKLLELEVGDQSAAKLPALKKLCADAEVAVQKEEKAIASLQGQESNACAQLTPKWNSQVDKLDKKAVDALQAEQKRLEDAGALAQFRQLEQDTAQREGWVNRLAEVARQIEEIPTDGRVQVAVAEQQLNAAKETLADAEAARDVAKKTADDLAVAAECFRKLVEEVAAAEKKADLHRKLDDLLGKGGLQRELVRSAEREIVQLANDTVQNLSNGDLSVELESGADGDDEAFALQVRRADGPLPIGVNYLSGSQKFRVAVSVALAIGRFAAGQARPLESVIIDEGFGSLDRDGLRAVAAELNRLRQHLRRIVLVSHQEEFADQFPAVIRLTQGENGVSATAVRR